MSKTITRSPIFDRVLPQSFRENILSILLKRIHAGILTVEFPTGRRALFKGTVDGPSAYIKIHNLRLIHRLIGRGDLGLAEGYMEGEWETPDLAGLISLGAVNADALKGTLQPNWFNKILNRLHHKKRANTKTGSRRNIAAHYDLGNEFYAQWLDPSMSYSSAIFEDMNEPMEAGQRRKYLRLAGSLALKPGECILEIGCGWGGFAEIAAAEYGCQVVCLTLSIEQAAYTKERMRRKGLAEQVEVRIQDYRDVEGQYDKIASIEMFEAVGQKYWRTYLQHVRARLKSGGRAAFQIITIDKAYFDDYQRNPDFIQRYIFPGGMLPSEPLLLDMISQSGLKHSDSYYFGKSYAETVRRWDVAFQKNWMHLKGPGFDHRFYRMWRYYLCYCEVGFEQGTIDVGQFVVENP